jgi:hypothetical protein
MTLVSPVAKVLLVYVLACCLLPVALFFVTDFDRAGDDIFRYSKNTLGLGLFGFAFAVTVALLSMIFGRHRLWHLLACALLCFIVGPFFAINDQYWFSLYAVIVLPVLLLSAAVGWLVMWFTRTKP